MGTRVAHSRDSAIVARGAIARPDAPVVRPTPRIVPARAALPVWHFRPLLVVRIAVLMILVGQLGRVPVLSTGASEAPLLVNDLFVMALLGVGLVTALASRQFLIDWVGGLGLLFISVGAISAILAIPRFGLDGLQLVISLAYLARWSVYFGTYLVVINVVRAGDVQAVWKALETMILIFAAFGIVQSIFLPHFAQLVYPESRVYQDWDEQGHRLVSTVLEPNIAGSMILLVLLIHLAQLASGERLPFWKPLLLFAALVASLSRSSFLGLMLGGLLIISIHGVSRRLMKVGGGVLLLALAGLPKIVQYASTYNKFTVDASALSRVENWLRALRLFFDHPFIGVGFNTYGYVQERYGFELRGASSFSVDGGLLFIAVMTGLLGLALYLGMLVVVLRRCRSLWRDENTPPEWKALATGIGVATVALCVQSLFVNALLTPFVMEMVWLLWGLTFAMRRGVVPRASATNRPLLVQARVVG
ncbi:MAG: hypothetical protein JWN79_3181 [Gemmatimonadetes bacterium]|jgi:O-antigen ligase|nr:hypothetical protein [Gemmatimonadota bacterium]